MKMKLWIIYWTTIWISVKKGKKYINDDDDDGDDDDN